jgi:hypothetical protein
VKYSDFGNMLQDIPGSIGGNGADAFPERENSPAIMPPGMPPPMDYNALTQSMAGGGPMPPTAMPPTAMPPTVMPPTGYNELTQMLAGPPQAGMPGAAAGGYAPPQAIPYASRQWSPSWMTLAGGPARYDGGRPQVF